MKHTFALFFLLAGSAYSQEQFLSLATRIDLPNVEGRIDHFSADLKGQRLFMSALGNHTLEVVDIQSGKRLQTLSDLAEPQGAYYDPASNHLFVACAKDGAVKVYDGSSYQLLNTAKFSADSDNVRYDARGHRVVVGYGDGALAFLDSAGKRRGRLPSRATRSPSNSKRPGPACS